MKQINDKEFEQTVLEASKTKPVFLRFWAEWCGPCRSVKPKIDELEQKYKDKIDFVEMNVDENPETPRRYGIRGIPNMLLFKDNEMFGDIVGNHPMEYLENFIKRYLDV